MKKLIYVCCLCFLAISLFSCAEEAKAVKETTKEAVKKTEAAAQQVAQKAKNTLKGEGLNVGDTAPDFSLKNIDGKMISLADFKDAKGFVITFTCNHCPYAVMYEDRLIDLHKMYEPKGYPVIAINPNDPEVKPEDSFDNMIVRAKEKNFPFVYLFDEGQKLYPQYGATRTPHVYLLDKDRVVKYIGALDDNAQDATAVDVKFVENAIGNMEAGKNPDPDFTKAIGCTIKKKS